MRRVMVTAAAAALVLAGACGGDDEDDASAEDPGPLPESTEAPTEGTTSDTGPTGPADAFCADFMAWAEEAASAEPSDEGLTPPSGFAPPEEIAADWYATDDEPIDTPEQVEKAERVDAWIQENCGPIPGVPGTAEPGM